MIELFCKIVIEHLQLSRCYIKHFRKKWYSLWVVSLMVWKLFCFMKLVQSYFLACKHPCLNSLFALIFIRLVVKGVQKFLATGSTLKMLLNAFYFTLKSFFVLKLFKFLSIILSLLFGHKEKRLYKKEKFISNLWRHSLGSKQLQYTYCAIPQEAKTMKFVQWNIWNIILTSYTKCDR